MSAAWSACCFRRSGSHADQLTDSEIEEMAPDGQMNDVTLESEHLEGPVLALNHRRGNTLILPDTRHKRNDGEVMFSTERAPQKVDTAASRHELNSGDKFGRSPLMYCIFGDRPECVEMLIKANVDINKKDIGGRTALHWAAHKGNFKCLKLLLNKGADWKAKDNDGQSAIHLSTRHKSPKCLALLLRHLQPGEVDDQDKNKRTALHWAASYGNLEHVKMLIKQDSNIGIPDVEGKTPLHWAASSKGIQAVDCVQIILDTAPSVINWQDYEGRTALHLAVADGNEAIVQALNKQKSLECNVSAFDNMFRTPLHWAAVLGHSHIAEMLLDSGADYASSDSNGATPLHYAAQNDYDETVSVFLQRKGLRDEPDMEGRTAFVWAAGKGADKVIQTFITYKADMTQTDKTGGTGHASTVKLLLQNSAQVNMTDLQKHTPLFRACEMGHTNVVQTLIDNGARVDIQDQDGRSPLHWAALGGHAYICQTLIKYGIEPNIRDNNGRTPLQCAAYGGFVNCMSVLIEHKADSNSQDKEGMTALHWACSKGHSDAVRLLIEFNAFPNHMEFTEDRYTPLDYALMGEHYDVAQYMIEQGALSITGIQDIAALKIQAVFRGYRVRKTFVERKRLLMKHEQLRKDAAKKKAEEECKRKDNKHKQEVAERRNKDESDADQSETSTDSGLESIAAENNTGGSVLQKPCATANHQAAPAPTALRKRRKEPVISEEEIIMRKKQVNQQVVKDERRRLKEFRRKDWAARVIQRAWKRRKLLRSLTPAKRSLLRVWNPSIIAAKQRAMVEQIYNQKMCMPVWQPKLKNTSRPTWFKLIPSAAAVSFNFALGQYFPHGEAGRHLRHSLSEYIDITADFDQMKVNDSIQPHHFSYNMYDS
ncbi:hypothetical protein LSH36_951g03000 [Paralvinella palmiformis]|uniref:Inversin n=1 Tax=Paralvinella palmiformis TaxID=53620 RepID=A0AAD9IWX1_9ANNE|nr:hypothetical protein LSH36_951g03000 [Paralvinella palmiformis]